MVEYLDENNEDSKQIIFGGMFFQSVWAYIEVYSDSNYNYLLASENALA